jgi:hypothetical protein
MIASQSQLWTSGDIANSSSGDRVMSGAWIEINDSAWVSNRSYIVICWLLIFWWFGRGGGKVVLVRGLIGYLLDIGEGVEWWLSCSHRFFCQS